VLSIRTLSALHYHVHLSYTRYELRYIIYHKPIHLISNAILMCVLAVSELDLSSNRFGGRLPLGLGCLKPTLQYLDISHNQYTEKEREELSTFLFERLTMAAPNIYV